MMRNPKSEAFWSVKNPFKQSRKIEFGAYKMKLWLTKKGFGQFTTTSSRLTQKTLFQNEDAILKIVDVNYVRKWMMTFLENLDELEYYRSYDTAIDIPNRADESCASKIEVLESFQEYGIGNLQSKTLNDLPVYSEEGFKDTQKLNLFADKKDTAHIRFKNGVVRITKDKVELLDYKKIKTDGAVWESSILDRDIKLLKNTDGGLFGKFINLAMTRNVNDENKKDWTKEYGHNEKTKEQLESLISSYGYMIHTHNTSDVLKAIYFIDADSEIDQPKGGNGKSVVMESLKYFKKTIKVDGKLFRNAMDGGGRFNFSNVTIDTKFVIIDDIRPEFTFEMLFSMITGDMEVEQKGKDKIIIPKDKKPKLGITTNYVIPGTGTSYTRRQHIVEFGNYFNRVNEEKEKPSDKKHLGKMLYDDFDENDWNEFYNFGFNAVQKYFKNGLIETENSDFQLKVVRASVEGSGGDGIVTGWIDNWIKKDRINYRMDLPKNAPSFDNLYSKFSEENEDYIIEWDKKRFKKALWDFCEGTQGYHFNKNKKGTTLSARRWLVGKAGEQKEHILITTDSDKEWLSKNFEKNMKKQQNYNLDDYFKNAFDEQDKVTVKLPDDFKPRKNTNILKDIK